MENIDQLIEEIRRFAMQAEKQSRYEHSVRVAETSEYMCGLYGIDAKKGYLAGIAHDICKNISEEEMKVLAAEDGNEITEVEMLKPSLLHGRAAAVLLSKKFGVDDPDIIQAVALHTFGGTDLCPLAKVVYSADKIEPGREHSTDEYRAKLFAMTLDELTLYVVEENMAYLKERGKKIAPSSIEFQESLRKKTGGN
ncbi:MAG: bis(5'-nucleosyl)-tetraphosphatase (symmetrical) YqeK [Spirochaetia bacterium]|nr:bis(5'-nucleosyl)-tetraphosphatase (symmetrical) YqeK [uncultured Treponema sp.]MCI7396795.1 bis(5'-nucleosyl)-tetraphosphatase (symmetrical) YqeK [Spirochaetia bacterium]MCI7577972.1 bis(5'-nucleosyl)-tetraphosphatase (symmetrical) YqeK [Spirochaetia bacterium]